MTFNVKEFSYVKEKYVTKWLRTIYFLSVHIRYRLQADRICTVPSGLDKQKLCSMIPCRKSLQSYSFILYGRPERAVPGGAGQCRALPDGAGCPSFLS